MKPCMSAVLLPDTQLDYGKEDEMKKASILTTIIIVALLASVAFAGDKGEQKTGQLFLFQKCDASLIPAADAVDAKYDATGCPLPGNGPWPIFAGNRRYGQMRYNLLGDEFNFSFEGKKVLPETDYTLIYYPDPWPGMGLICLGSSTSNHAGNLQINGKLAMTSGLPAPYDKNFNPVEPSGATGAKIWLVSSADVKCENSGDIDPDSGLPADPSQMVGWNPTSYLFEANLIVFQFAAEMPGDEEEDDVTPGDEVDNPDPASSHGTFHKNHGYGGKDGKK